MPIDHARIHENGWRQGSVLTAVDSEAILYSNPRPQPPTVALTPQTRLVIASHSCDVVSQSPIEINVEFCPAMPLRPDASTDLFGYGRDPRRLRLPIEIDGNVVLHEMYAPLRFSAPRALLEGISPDRKASISPNDLPTFEYWLAARVRRRVFPNSFDERLDTKNHKRIRKALASVEPHVVQFLYSLSPQSELNDAVEPYRLVAVLLVHSASMRDQAVLEQLETSRDRIEEILQSRPGIAATVSLVSDEKMNYADFQTYSQWGFEDLSLEAGERDRE